MAKKYLGLHPVKNDTNGTAHTVTKKEHEYIHNLNKRADIYNKGFEAGKKEAHKKYSRMMERMTRRKNKEIKILKMKISEMDLTNAAKLRKFKGFKVTRRT